MRVVLSLAAVLFVGCGAVAGPTPSVAHEPAPAPALPVVAPAEDDCVAKEAELEDAATRVAADDTAAAANSLWLTTALPDEKIVALRLETPGGSSFWSDKGPLPARVALDPTAVSVRVRAVVRMADGRCQTADAEITVEAAPLLTGATIAVRRGALVVEPSPPTYSVRLRDLERRVDELKEHVFRTKPRLTLLEGSLR